MKRAQHGLSMVELMVGIAIGLVVVAAALSVLTQHLRENRNLLLEARLLQDLRTTTDLMARDLRRAGYWADAGAGVWHETRPAHANPHAALSTGDAIGFSYSRGSAGDAAGGTKSDDAVSGALGYRLRKGVIEMRFGEGNWQAMTDAGTMTVVELAVTPTTTEISLAGACTKPCAATGDGCPPVQQVRSVALRIQARSATDASVTQSAQARVRLRNDTVAGACSP